MRKGVPSVVALNTLLAERQLRKSERGSAARNLKRLGCDRPRVFKVTTKGSSQFEEEGRLNKAMTISENLFAAGIKAWQVERFDPWQWLLASWASKVNLPSERSRQLIVVLMKAKEEATWRLEPLVRCFGSCESALEGVLCPTK